MRRLLAHASTAIGLLLTGAAHAEEPAAPSATVDIAPLPATTASRAETSVATVVLPGLPAGTPTGFDGTEAARQPVGTLGDALDRTYWTSPKLLAERSRMRATDYRVPQARSLFGPKLVYQASYGYQRDNFELATGGYVAQSGWSSVASAILTQPLYTFGRNAAAEHTAVAQVTFQRSVLRYSEQQAIYEAITAYASVLRDRAGVGIAGDNLALLERELADTATRFKAREVTSTDLDQVRTRVEQGRAQVYSAQRLAASSDARFLSIVGAPAGTLVQPNPLPVPAASLEEAYAYAEQHDPVITAAYAREKISRAQKDAAKAEMKPRIDLRGRADYGSVSPYTDNLRETQLRGEVIVSGPLFESGLRRARVAEADATNDADWRMIDNAVREQRAEVADAWNEWLSQSASIGRLKAAASAADTAYAGALLQERAGLRTTLDVLDLARELLIVRSSYNAASANAYVAQARLLAAMGALDYGNLFPDKPGYDPAAHFDKVNNSGDVPLLTPLLRGLDGVLVGKGKDRPLRDPASKVGVVGVPLPTPAAGQ